MSEAIETSSFPTAEIQRSGHKVSQNTYPLGLGLMSGARAQWMPSVGKGIVDVSIEEKPRVVELHYPKENMSHKLLVITLWT